jgi:serine/threonine-protein kinase RsbW
MPLGIDLELTLPSETSTVPLVRHILQYTLMQFGVDTDCVGDVMLAVTEACANVVEHADGDDEYQIEVSVDGSRCEIRVIDTGHGFDQALAGQMPENDAEGGRGLLLMKSLMDTLSFDSEKETGTVVHLTKKLQFATVPPWMPASSGT